MFMGFNIQFIGLLIHSDTKEKQMKILFYIVLFHITGS